MSNKRSLFCKKGTDHKNVQKSFRYPPPTIICSKPWTILLIMMMMEKKNSIYDAPFMNF